MTLCIPRLVPPDGNPCNPDRIQVSGGSRTTEDDAARHIIDAPPPVPMMNGQEVNTSTMLMCSRCGTWRKDKLFPRDRARRLRRGRSYYCTSCWAEMRRR